MFCFRFSISLVFLSFLSFLSFTTAPDPTYLYHFCVNTTTLLIDNTFQTNLNLLLTSLSSATIGNNDFYTNSTGQKPNKAYVRFLCRGDYSIEVCQTCVSFATKDIVQRCPMSREAIIWYDECFLRYSQRSIFSTVEEIPSVSLLNTQNVTDQDSFNELVGVTMDELAVRTATDPSGVKKFATREANISGFQTLYTLAQCTADLSSSDCNRCLRGAIAGLPSCCSGKQGGRVLFPSCNVRYELYPFYNLTAIAAVAPTPVLLPPPPSVIGKSQISSVTIIAIVVPIAVSVVLLFIGYCILTRRARKKGNAVQEDYAGINEEIATVESLQFNFSTIEAATDKFSDDNKLGEGGFGVVYKGKLPNGQEIAVKRLSRSSDQGAEEFKNEVELVAKLQHRNLVRLLGFCLEGEEKILVYEFVANKSLDYFLYDPEKRVQLDWSRRYKIIREIARGIRYLHEDSLLKIIHRDLKVSNILLDGDINPKISDFGMARIFGADQTQANTNRIAGTRGYMSPEYAMNGQFSVKSDVYSFGVLILEIISGKRNRSFYQSDGTEDLLSYAWKHWSNGTPLELLDPTMTESYSRNEVIRCIHIGLLCVQENPADRPTMATIVLMLNSYSVTLQLPQQPSFSLHSRTEMTMPCSVDEATITEVYPR